jgi:hypothetical protein
MKLNQTLLTVSLGLTIGALSSYATTVNILDVFNLTGQGPDFITNAGGGNQHQQSKDPIFSFAGGDLPRLVFQRGGFSNSTSDYSYLQIYSGPITKNQDPPAGSPIITGSTVFGGAVIPDFTIDFGAANNAASQQIQALLLAYPTITYTIAIVEVNITGPSTKPKLTYTTRGSVQFNFPNLHNIGGTLSNPLNINTQFGHG